MFIYTNCPTKIFILNETLIILITMTDEIYVCPKCNRFASIEYAVTIDWVCPICIVNLEKKPRTEHLESLEQCKTEK